MKRVFVISFVVVIVFLTESAIATPITVTHTFNGTKFGINPGGQPVASLLTTVIQANTSSLTGVGTEFVPLDSLVLNFTPLVPGELSCSACTISAADRNAHYRVRFVGGVYIGYEMFGAILAGGGRVFLLNSTLGRTGFSVGGGFKNTGLGLADRQTILFGTNFRTKYGPTSFTIQQNPPPAPAPAAGTIYLLGSGLVGLFAFRKHSL